MIAYFIQIQYRSGASGYIQKRDAVAGGSVLRRVGTQRRRRDGHRGEGHRRARPDAEGAMTGGERTTRYERAATEGQGKIEMRLREQAGLTRDQSSFW